MRARYILRFDDICQTMNWEVWAEVEAVLLENGIRPILAVVPDNRDEGLKVGPARPDFWEHVRRWRGLGWTIGLHGYQHRYVTRDAGLMGLNARSEFAGLPRGVQEDKLRRAMEIFRREGVGPDVWVAPGHSFDRTTLRILKNLDIRTVSDGFSLFPWLDDDGILWIPQQLWRLRPVPPGVWTVCFHHNAWQPEDVARFRMGIRRYRETIVGLQDVVAAYGGRRPGLIDRLMAPTYRVAIRLRRRLAGREP